MNELVSLNGLDMGTGTSYLIGEPGISGLGTPQTKTADASYDGQDGASAAPDFLDVRVITVPLVLNGTTALSAMSLLDAVNAAWAPARDGIDVTLDISIDTWGWTYTGRARGVDADLVDVAQGVILALCRFDAMEPVGSETGS